MGQNSYRSATVSLMSVLKNYDYENIALGKTDEMILDLITTGLAGRDYHDVTGKWSRSTSAYNIYSFLNSNDGKPYLNYKLLTDRERWLTLKPQHKRTMTYPGVLKSIKSLEELGLIEQDGDGKGKRSAIMYKLTSLGLFRRLLSNSFVNINEVDKYRDDTILQTILYQFFEPETINKFHDERRGVLLYDYLKKCCQAISIWLNINRISKMSSDDLSDEMELQVTEVDKLIKNEAEKFAFQITRNAPITIKSLLPAWRTNPDTYTRRQEGKPRLMLSHPSKVYVEPEDPDRKYLYPKAALASDRKFRGILEETKKDFDEGYRFLIA